MWCEELEKLSEYVKTQPHVAYAAFHHGELHKYTYFMRTIPGMEEYIETSDNILTQKFIPNLLDSVVTDLDRKLFSLPVKSGGLGIPILSESCNIQLKHSREIASPLKSVIVEQSSALLNCQTVKEIKNEKKREREQILKEKTEIIDQHLSPETKKAVEDKRLPGASS